MGSAMARRLLAHGFKVRAWNRTRARAEPLAARGAEVTDSPRAAASGADVLLTILSDGPTIEAAMTGPDGALAGAARGTLWLQMSTVGVAPCARLSSLAAGAGLVFVDAPVMGTKDPAERGEITILASGPADAEGRARPIFEKLGKKILWLGEAGAGSRMKLVGNSWVTGMTTALSETITFARVLGVDPKKFMEMLTGGPLDSAYAQLKGGYMIADQFPQFPAAPGPQGHPADSRVGQGRRRQPAGHDHGRTQLHGSPGKRPWGRGHGCGHQGPRFASGVTTGGSPAYQPA